MSKVHAWKARRRTLREDRELERLLRSPEREAARRARLCWWTPPFGHVWDEGRPQERTWTRLHTCTNCGKEADTYDVDNSNGRKWVLIASPVLLGAIPYLIWFTAWQEPPSTGWEIPGLVLAVAWGLVSFVGGLAALLLLTGPSGDGW